MKYVSGLSGSLQKLCLRALVDFHECSCKVWESFRVASPDSQDPLFQLWGPRRDEKSLMSDVQGYTRAAFPEDFQLNTDISYIFFYHYMVSLHLLSGRD